MHTSATMKVATHMTLMVLLGLEIKGALIATAMPKPTLTSLKLTDLAVLEMVERLTPSLLFLYALSQALRRHL